MNSISSLTEIVFINILVYSMQSETVGSENPLERFWSSSPGTTANSVNVTVYLGYANNPFGPAIRFQDEKGKENYNIVTTSPRPSQHLSTKKTPEHNSVKNYVDTGQPKTPRESRSKRGVLHLYNMVSCATGCDPIVYKGYGCYCGFLGSGYAVDGIDRCCKKHDWCYDTSNCPTFLEYFVPYYWKCYRNKPLCAVDHGEWGGAGSCAQRLCECDKMLSECLSRYPCPSSRALCRSSPLRLLQNAFMIF